MSGEPAHITLYGEQICMDYELAHNGNHVHRDGDPIQIHKPLHMTYELGGIYDQAYNYSRSEESSRSAQAHSSGYVSQIRKSKDL